MPVDVILGLQWGDEGKGKLVDMLAKDYALVARFQGGANAGHTLYIDGKKHVLHQIPSGIMHATTQNLISHGAVLDPIELHLELEQIAALVPKVTERLYIAQGAHLILPLHKQLDLREEAYRGRQQIGSTQRGIGPCYQDKYARRGLRVSDLADLSAAKKKYDMLKKWHAPYLDILDSEEEKFWAAAEALKQLQLVDSTYFVQSFLAADKPILAEGAQGTLLDVDHGTYPYVTSSHTSIGGVCTGLGIAPKHINRIYGVCKAYCTRVGAGPFPSEIHDEVGKQIGEKGKEIGATTGRIRRCGWLDVSALQHAVQYNGVNQLFLTKVDVLAGMREVKLCTHYTQAGNLVDRHAVGQQLTAALDAHYTTLPSWPTDSVFATPAQWPPSLIGFLKKIGDSANIPITGFSYGPTREDFVLSKEALTQKITHT